MKRAIDLLKGVAVSQLDAARLILDAVERLSTGEESTPPREQLLSKLKRVVELGTQAVLAEEATESFANVAWQSVEARKGRRASTQRDLRHFVRRMLRVPGVAERPLRAMTSRECRKLLEIAFGNSLHSYRKGRVILHSIFAFGMRHEWCDTNPVDRIETPEISEKYIEPLTPEETLRLQCTARTDKYREMRFSLHLMLYGGMRPAEVARLVPERDIMWQERTVIVRPTVSKTGGGRIIPIQGWGDLCRADCVVPRSWQKRWRALRQAAGFVHWVPDICRHTFASYHAALFRDLPRLQLEMGHRDLNLLRTRYMVPTTRSVAMKFWKACRYQKRALPTDTHTEKESISGIQHCGTNNGTHPHKYPPGYS